MRRPFRFLAYLIFFLILAFAFVVNFSAVSQRYECTGIVAKDGSSLDSTIFLKFERYRWWVGLWGESDGNLYVEAPNQFTRYFGVIHESGEQTQIFDFDGSLKGNFSSLSLTLALDLPIGFFDGRCQSLEDRQ